LKGGSSYTHDVLRITPLLALFPLLAAGACAPAQPAARGPADLAANLAAAPVEYLVAGEARGQTGGARVVAGFPEDPAVAGLLGHLEVGLEEGDRGPTLQGRPLDWRTTSLVAVWRDPERPALPLTLLVAGDRARLELELETLVPGWRPGLELRRAGEPWLRARLTIDGRLQSSTLVEETPAYQRDPGRFRRMGFADGVITTRSDPTQISRAHLEQYVLALEEAIARAAWCELALPKRLELIAEARVEGPFPQGAPRSLATYDPLARRLRALLVAAPGGGRGLDDGGRALAAGLLRAELGDPAQGWMLDAAALDAADRLGGVPLERWCAHLALEREWSLEEILAEDVLERESPWAVLPLRALLFRALRESLSPAELLERWSTEGDRALDGVDFGARLQRLRDERGGTLAEEQAARRAGALEGPWRGAILLAPPASGEHGLGSPGCAEAFEDLSELGASAVTLRCHSVADRGAGSGRPSSPPPASCVLEGDAALLVALAQARAQGLRTALQPALLSSLSGGLDGDRLTTGVEMWRAHLEARRATLLHAGLLAELGGAELLFLGSGTPQAAATAPAPGSEGDEGGGIGAWREARIRGWDRILTGVRPVFTGALSYAADYPGRADEIGFWERLDLVALNLRPDLTPLDTPALPQDKLLGRRLGRLLDQAREFAAERGGPLLISEVGFRSVHLAGQRRTERGGAASEVGQARVLDAWIAVLEELEEDALLGVLIAGWPTDPSGERRSRGPSLAGKRAARSLRTLFESRAD